MFLSVFFIKCGLVQGQVVLEKGWRKVGGGRRGADAGCGRKGEGGVG